MSVSLVFHDIRVDVGLVAWVSPNTLFLGFDEPSCQLGLLELWHQCIDLVFGYKIFFSLMSVNSDGISKFTFTTTTVGHK